MGHPLDARMGHPPNPILLIIVGIALEVIAFVNKQFYASKGCGGATDKKVPRWAGRLVFAGVGAMFIIGGIAKLLGK